MSYGAISGGALDRGAFSGIVVLQIEHEASANVLDHIHSIGGERHRRSLVDDSTTRRGTDENIELLHRSISESEGPLSTDPGQK